VRSGGRRCQADGRLAPGSASARGGAANPAMSAGGSPGPGPRGGRWAPASYADLDMRQPADAAGQAGGTAAAHAHRQSAPLHGSGGRRPGTGQEARPRAYMLRVKAVGRLCNSLDARATRSLGPRWRVLAADVIWCLLHVHAVQVIDTQVCPHHALTRMLYGDLCSAEMVQVAFAGAHGCPLQHETSHMNKSLAVSMLGTPVCQCLSMPNSDSVQGSPRVVGALPHACEPDTYGGGAGRRAAAPSGAHCCQPRRCGGAAPR
jgi:hypothetical protein